MTNAGVISAQHPKNASAIVWSSKKGRTHPKKQEKNWWWIKWSIKTPIDPTPSNFSNITMVQILNFAQCCKIHGDGNTIQSK